MPRCSVRAYPPAPPEFAAEFAAGGWRRVERLYGARTDVILKWIATTGAQALRDAVLRRGLTAVTAKRAKE